MRLLVLSLLRAGKIEATSKGQTIDTRVTGVEARDTFSNNNLFRQASFRPKKGIEFEELVKASEAFRDTFGSEVKELNARRDRRRAAQGGRAHEDTVASRRSRQLTRASPAGRRGARRRLGQMKAILRGSEDNAIATFNASHRHQGRHQARRRARAGADASRASTTSSARAQRWDTEWPFLDARAGPGARAPRAGELARTTSCSARPSSRELPAIDTGTRRRSRPSTRARRRSMGACEAAYVHASQALARARRLAGDSTRTQQRATRRPASSRVAKPHVRRMPIPQLRADAMHAPAA